MNRYALIVAGGTGSRMGSNTPKQFMLLDGMPVLMHTIQAFLDFSPVINVVLVLPAESVGTWVKLCESHNFMNNALVVHGGESRYHSVKNGLNAITDPDGYVAIHDGARPLIRPDIIAASFNLAETFGSAIASTMLKESLRRISGNLTISVNRSAYRLIQTPQTFKVRLIKDAYQAINYHSDLTDDASVAEAYGHVIHLFDGDFRNIKITTPEDLLIARALIENKKGGLS